MSTRIRIKELEKKMESLIKELRDGYVINSKSDFDPWPSFNHQISLLELQKRQRMILNHLGVEVISIPYRELLKKKKKVK